MAALHFLQKTLSPARKAGGASVLALAVLAFGGATFSSPAAAASGGSNTTLSSVAAQLQADYRQQQWQRLSEKTDRDSLIAAVLIGMPTESHPETMNGQLELEQRLAALSSQDPLALFVLALACQAKTPLCQQPGYYDALVRLAPDNAVHWLLLPNGEAPSKAQLHQAGLATLADSHTRELARIVRAALGDQPIIAVPAGMDPRELALLQRRNAVDLLASPNFAGGDAVAGPALDAARRAASARVDTHVAPARAGGTVPGTLPEEKPGHPERPDESDSTVGGAAPLLGTGWRPAEAPSHGPKPETDAEVSLAPMVSQCDGRWPSHPSPRRDCNR